MRPHFPEREREGSDARRTRIAVARTSNSRLVEPDSGVASEPLPSKMPRGLEVWLWVPNGGEPVVVEGAKTVTTA